MPAVLDQATAEHLDQLKYFAVVLAFLVVAVAFMAGPLLIQRFVAPRKPNPEKLTTYECGEDAIGTPWIKFNIRFYVFALLFLIFDVELIFVLPWAVVYRDMTQEVRRVVRETSVVSAQAGVADMGAGAEIEVPMKAGPPIERRLNASEGWGAVWLYWFEGVLFILVLVVGLAYVWAKGDLEWARPRILEAGGGASPRTAPEPSRPATPQGQEAPRHVASA